MKNIVGSELLKNRLGNGRYRYRFAERIENLDEVTDLSANFWMYIHSRCYLTPTKSLLWYILGQCYLLELLKFHGVLLYQDARL